MSDREPIQPALSPDEWARLRSEATEAEIQGERVLVWDDAHAIECAGPDRHALAAATEKSWQAHINRETA